MKQPGGGMNGMIERKRARHNVRSALRLLQLLAIAIAAFFVGDTNFAQPQKAAQIAHLTANTIVWSAQSEPSKWRIATQAIELQALETESDEDDDDDSDGLSALITKSVASVAKTAASPKSSLRSAPQIDTSRFAIRTRLARGPPA